jgi:transposase InsO family protein
MAAMRGRFVMGEYSTRYMIAEPMKDQTAECIHDAFLRRIVLVHGVPEEVLTDQGTNFLSKTMDELYKQLGVKRKRTAAYRPCCDGLVKRFNRTLGDILASYVSKGSKNWDEFVSHATFAYNTAVHAGTGYTPHYLMFGRDPKEPEDRNMIFAKMLNLAKETARERLIESQVKQKQYYEKGKKITNYEMGDQVLLKELDD